MDFFMKEEQLGKVETQILASVARRTSRATSAKTWGAVARAVTQAFIAEWDDDWSGALL